MKAAPRHVSDHGDTSSAPSTAALPPRDVLTVAAATTASSPRQRGRAARRQTIDGGAGSDAITVGDAAQISDGSGSDTSGRRRRDWLFGTVSSSTRVCDGGAGAPPWTCPRGPLCPTLRRLLASLANLNGYITPSQHEPVRATYPDTITLGGRQPLTFQATTPSPRGLRRQTLLAARRDLLLAGGSSRGDDAARLTPSTTVADRRARHPITAEGPTPTSPASSPTQHRHVRDPPRDPCGTRRHWLRARRRHTIIGRGGNDTLDGGDGIDHYSAATATTS